jgi:hypothetical protein
MVDRLNDLPRTSAITKAASATTPLFQPSSPSIRLRASTSTVARDSVRPVRVALPCSDATVLVLCQVLVGEARSGGEIDGGEPQRVGAGVLCGTECNSLGGVPAAKLRDASRDVDSLAKVGGVTLVECDCGERRGGVALTGCCGSCGAAWPGCVCGRGARAGCRPTRAGGGELGLKGLLVADGKKVGVRWTTHRRGTPGSGHSLCASIECGEESGV